MKEKLYDELDFTDDFLFCRILSENEDLCIELAELITGRRIKSLVSVNEQKSVRMTRDGKGVRFDVFFADEEDVVYDIEMQTTGKTDLPKRSRYYQGMIDLNILSRGEGYEQLKESYIIFICTYDEFGKGRHKYTFEQVCLENPTIRLKDGTHKIFLCAEGERNDCSEKMKDFLNYVAGKEATGTLVERLRKEVEKSKAKERWRLDYMTLWEKYREKYNEGREEGREEQLIQMVCRKLRKGKDPVQIAGELDEDEARIRAICNIAAGFAPDYDEAKVVNAVLDLASVQKS